MKDEVPGVNVTGAVGNQGDFEITVNGQLIFSKQSKKCFPMSEAVVKEVKAIAGGKPPEKVTETESYCLIL